MRIFAKATSLKNSWTLRSLVVFTCEVTTKSFKTSHHTPLHASLNRDLVLKIVTYVSFKVGIFFVKSIRKLSTLHVSQTCGSSLKAIVSKYVVVAETFECSIAQANNKCRSWEFSSQRSIRCVHNTTQ